jgi:DNA-directed RNA polymerase subunit RPC12/RpoP
VAESEKNKAYRREWAKRKYANEPEKHRAYAREQHEKHKAKKRLANAKYREENKERIRAQNKVWRDANKDTVKRNNLKLVFFTPELLEKMLVFQEYKCAICGEDLRDKPSKNTHADHCHNTQTPRGVLCSPCNTGIGLLRDDPARLQKAIDYLKTPTVEAMKRRKKR